MSKTKHAILAVLALLPVVGMNAASARQGYFFTYAWVNLNQYTLTATPAVANVTGTGVFFVDETGVIRLTNAAGAEIQ